VPMDIARLPSSTSVAVGEGSSTPEETRCRSWRVWVRARTYVVERSAAVQAVSIDQDLLVLSRAVRSERIVSALLCRRVAHCWTSWGQGCRIIT
jgi:hypothetical protein